MIRCFTFFLLLFSTLSYSQLPEFTLTVEVTDETCPGDGALAISVASGITDPDATVAYQIYLLPDEVNPIDLNPLPGGAYPEYLATKTGLIAGTYKVVATQTLGGVSDTAEWVGVIEDELNPIGFAFDVKPIKCGDDAEITVNVYAGNPLDYELVSLPDLTVVYPPQSSNIFSDVGAGMYLVRIRSVECPNDTDATTVIIPDATLAAVNFVGPGELEPNLDSCTTGVVTVPYTLEVPIIAYPISVTYNVYAQGVMPPAAPSWTWTQNNIAGPPLLPGQLPTDMNQQNISQDIPFYYDPNISIYHYQIVITNDCGDYINVSSLEPVEIKLDVSAEVSKDTCYGIDVTVENFVNWFELSFTEFPAGFNPPALNVDHPGPFTEAVKYSIVLDYELLAGHYAVTAVDECGREGTFEFDVPEEIPEPQTTLLPTPPVFANDCRDEGTVLVSHQHNLAEVYITEAPEEFRSEVGWPANDDNYRYDISDYINPDSPSMLEFPGLVGLGDYTVLVIDICGNEFPIERPLLPYPYPANEFAVDLAPGCEGFGSVKISPSVSDEAGDIVAVWITGAPQAFVDMVGAGNFIDGRYDAFSYAYHVPGATPADPGFWHVAMNELPGGYYEFEIMIECMSGEVGFFVEAYQQVTDNLDIEEFCNAFELYFEDISNVGDEYAHLTEYWLERYNEDTESWENFLGGGNRFMVVSGQVNTVTGYQGLFRIVKKYNIHGIGGNPQECVEVIEQFPFYDRPKLNSVTLFPCSDGGNEVIVDATGVAPLQYQVWTSVVVDGVLTLGQLITDNGESNIFVGLDPNETYFFRITDGCTRIRTESLQIDDSFTWTVTENNLCENQLGFLSVPSFSFITYEWWKEGEPGDILSESNVLIFNPFDSEDHSGTYYVSIVYNGDEESCVNQTLSIDVEVELPNAGEDRTADVCHTDQDIDLFSLFGTEYDEGGEWQDVDATGALQDNIFKTEGLPLGTYTFRYFVDSGCNGNDEAFLTITLLDMPEAPQVEAFDAVCIGGDLMLSIENANAQYTYIWTLPNGNTYQGDTVSLTDVTTQEEGLYTVIASLGNCESDAASVNVVFKPLPDFYIGGNTVICLGQSTTLSVVGANFQNSEATFAWYFNNTEIPSLTTSSIDASDLGEYAVVVTLDDCEAYYAVVVTEKADMPAIDLLVGCVENNFIISVVNTDAFPNASYEWTGPDGFSSTDTSIDLTGLALGEYQIKVTDTDGCVVSDIVDVQSTECMIPKGISPNDDLINDAFDLSNFNVSNLQIFNRYGRVVYEAKNGYTNQWHGQTTNGSELLPTATYYYVVTFIDGNKKTGWVYLNRKN